MRIQYVVVPCILILNACAFEPAPNESLEDSNSINPLHFYFETFEAEAKKRNLSINLDQMDLTSEIKEIAEEHVAGTCSYSSHFTNHITIDASFWNSASALSKEMVVFHELGHCVLAQGHREDTDTEGNCLSIMQSGTEGCRLLYNEINRDYYLDEFFLFEQ